MLPLMMALCFLVRLLRQHRRGEMRCRKHPIRCYVTRASLRHRQLGRGPGFRPTGPRYVPTEAFIKDRVNYDGCCAPKMRHPALQFIKNVDDSGNRQFAVPTLWLLVPHHRPVEQNIYVGISKRATTLWSQPSSSSQTASWMRKAALTL